MRVSTLTTLLFLPLALAGAQTRDSVSRPAEVKPDTSGPPIHMRVLGVFDEQTGEPVADADVFDMSTGLTARTTRTGTVALILRDTGSTLVRIRKVGYRPFTTIVNTGLRDTTPVTTTILRNGVALAPVITVGNRSVRLGVRDTVGVLLRNGFYERRETGGAPGSAFISGDRLQGSTVVTNAHYYGRAICESNLFIDGMKVSVPRRTGRFLREGVDALVDVSEIAGIETYRTGEMPASATHTMEGAQALDVSANSVANSLAAASGTMVGTGCVTMIWLNR